ncbi:MAG: sugar ABC transporter permease [Butyrivibrio sp.]|jgi:raffinose/stachyose/melibiose transport system permease protein|uniref:carbohydrate ABC transporter permease n=1 Tax=Butyrivibrio sp. TaxID=28121 RepID=UPI001B6F62B3|nr:sugar ABC transporter permease [Butyrivibrio sp.]MBE5829902.1 sugar ABC transporter permease [Butyrivibrio sp.]MBP3274117.1 sugar ABC transporter permease [Butyrivibrio sp.]MBP3279524.1 sugar ABC transporter permease [Butyrivibrio sp.]MBP3782536.1 sugar ABC transporter permease [Butyrivibrio sp.]
MSNIYRNKKYVLLFLLPAFLFLVVYLYYPFLVNIYGSFRQIKNLGTYGTKWNEPFYDNYVKLVTDPVVWTSLKNTVLMILATIVGQVGIALLLSLLVDNIERGTQFFRTVYFFPIVISATALGLLFNLIFLYDKGMLNQFLELFGKTTLTDWKGEKLAIFTMMLPVVWQYVGFYFVILETGLNNISQELYESAAIDGATRFQRVIYISIPLLRNVICTCLTLGVTGALKVFDLPWTMFPKGMPLKETFLTGTYMYYQTMEAKNVDYGATLAVLIVVLGVVLSRLTRRVFKESEDF